MRHAPRRPSRATTLLLTTLLALLALASFGSAAIEAAQHTLALAPGDSITIDCPTALRGRVRGRSSTISCAAPAATATPPPATATPPPATATPPPGSEQPVAGQLCPAWVHDSYTSSGPDGKTYPTWHPPVDRQHGCFFDHEHGSDPRSYLGFMASGLPAFGYTAAQHGMEEPHKGFKVYVANDDLNGRAWMITLHQGSGGPRRAREQFHTLDWHISARDGTTLVDLHLMADFGYAVPNCGPVEALPGTATGRPFSIHDPARRSLPTVDCASEIPYETWSAAIDVGGLFQATPKFDIDNATTVINPRNLDDLRFMCEFRTPTEDCRSPRTQWTGNKRGVLHPGQLVQNNSGSPWVLTDVYGKPINPAHAEHAHGAIRQYISTRGWDTRNCCGNQVLFRIQSYSQGVYIADPREEAGSAQFGVGQHRWPN